MARKQPSGVESKQGLVITLVFSIIVTIIVGVVAFLGYSDQEGLNKKITDLEKEKKVLSAEIEWRKFQYLVTRDGLGADDLKDDEKDALKSLRGKNNENKLGTKMSDKEDFDKTLKRLDEELIWDDNQKTYQKKFKKMRDDAQTALAQGNAKWEQIAKDNETANKNLKDAIATKDKELQAKDATIAELNGRVTKTNATKTTEVITLIDELKKMGVAQEEQTVAAANDKAAAEKQIEKLKKDIKLLDSKYQRDISANVAAVDMLKYDKAKGKIISLDRTGDVAYVNLGSADKVRPQLTFSIFSSNTMGQPKDELRKAALEIINVLEPKLSMARITYTKESDRGRDPVVGGDLLFNPAWDPNEREHIAIAGLVDLTGSGTDSSLDFLRAIEKQNIEVDFFLDLKDPELKARGSMTLRTKYLVVGAEPKLDSTVALNQNDPRFIREKLILEKMSEVKHEAGRLGVTLVPANRFVELIGFKIPKNYRPADYTSPGGLNVGKPAMPKDGEGNNGDKPNMEKPKDAENKPPDK